MAKKEAAKSASGKKFKVQPLDDRVLIEQSEAEERTAGGILLPDAAKEKPQRGEIVAVGQGKLLDDGKRAAMTVKVGDQVVYGKYSGNEIKLDGTKYVIVRESDILGVLED
ncbi:MAG: co-chaperone GroES [Phycisphaerae bacterium]|nr:co-chaperone GroES [Phycisphaerae bacterium]